MTRKASTALFAVQDISVVLGSPPQSSSSKAYVSRTPSVVAVVITLAACNVPVRHGGAGVGTLTRGDAAGAMDGSAGSVCGRGVVVVEQGPDYLSTNVALLANDGSVLQGSLASSATSSVGLTAPLTGDVVPPTAAAHGSEIVLVDRGAGASRLVWVDLATAKRRILPVDTGFASYPQDFAQVSATKAYVPRYGQNPSAGKVPFDSGSDLLVVDPMAQAITGSIDLRSAVDEAGTHVLPDAMKAVVVGPRAFVLLAALSSDSSANTSSRLVTVDVATDAITDVLTLEGFEDCAGLAVSPDETALAVLCSGAGNIQTSPTELTGSGLAVIDVNAAPVVVKSFRAADLGQNRIGFSGDYSGDTSLVFQTFGYSDVSTGAEAKDTLVRLDLTSGRNEVLLDGAPFSLGGIACRCGACFVADSDRQGGVVHRFAVDDAGALSNDRPKKVERDPGLRPRTLGKF
jgi:hypothetical protein